MEHPVVKITALGNPHNKKTELRNSLQLAVRQGVLKYEKLYIILHRRSNRQIFCEVSFLNSHVGYEKFKEGFSAMCKWYEVGRGLCACSWGSFGGGCLFLVSQRVLQSALH